MDMNRVIYFAPLTVLVFTAICLVRSEGTFWQLVAKELHSQCIRMDIVACIGFKIQRATRTGFQGNNSHGELEMARHVDKMLIQTFMESFNSSHWQTTREIKEKFRTLDSIVDVVAELAKSSFKEYASSKGPFGGSRRKSAFIPLLLGIVLKVLGLVPLLLGKLAIIGLIAFFVSKLSLVIVALISLKKIFQSSGILSYPYAGMQYHGHPYYYHAHPHEYYESSQQHFGYPQQYYERGHQDTSAYQYSYDPKSHYGYTQYYSPESYQGVNGATGRLQRDFWSSYPSSAKPPLKAVVPDVGAGLQGIPSFYTPMRRRRRGIRKFIEFLVSHEKDAKAMLNDRRGRDNSSWAGQRRLGLRNRRM